jgi:hypothetical protein
VILQGTVTVLPEGCTVTVMASGAVIAVVVVLPAAAAVAVVVVFAVASVAPAAVPLLSDAFIATAIE